MRAAAYLREPPDPTAMTTLFAQGEIVRRWATEGGHHLVAVCHDRRKTGDPTGRNGYLSLVAVAERGQIDAVVLPSLDTFSSDQIVQEIMIWDMRSRGVIVLTVDEAENASLSGTDPGPTRQFVRDVLARVAEHARLVSIPPSRSAAPPNDMEVVVELIAATHDETEAGPDGAGLADPDGVAGS